MGNPYKKLSKDCFWLDFINKHTFREPKFKIKDTDKVMTAGSCFARRISEYIKPFITEDLHPRFRLEEIYPSFKQAYQYGTFTARYDNMYTVRQFLQLFQRAFGIFNPNDTMWQRSDGKYLDAFRPEINPEGYISENEMLASRKHHFKCVREAFQNLDVLLFTLGLTEAWTSKLDGAIYPICPGVRGMGTYDSEKYAFIDFSVGDLADDFGQLLTLLKSVNNKAKIIITVSPTPMLATATGRPVIEVNFEMKSKLRVACSEICKKHPRLCTSHLMTYF